ncbi:serine/threonine-protein kinase fray2-like [Aphis craccivora]|uniref:Serine/threonine-protein kinase fray2-like n=1 Tax=Aphis craccivora TaxID=307492 RepID=A0A6G0YWJ4_APHCR|nr:serine/threonine-protein kinase fray2-like [Aphis craccivora]
MTNLINQLKDPRSDYSITINTATDIYTLKKPFLIQYCEDKNPKSTGTTTELRARLSRYLREAITLEDTLSYPIQVPIKKTATYSTSLALYDNLNNSLNSFSNRVEKILENANTSGSNSRDQSTQLYQNTLIHFENSITSPENSKHIYQEIISDINEWNENDKLKYFSIFVKGIVSTFLENLEDQKRNLSWKELEETFFNEFQPIGHDTILQIKLEKRRQGKNETTTSFLAEIESLCRQVNKHMSEKGICGYILKCLKDNILQSISMQDNNSLKSLKENFKKFELMQFRIKNKKDDMSKYTEILNKQVLQLNQKTKDIEIKNYELRMKIKDSFSRDRDNKINIRKFSEEIQKIKLLKKDRNILMTTIHKKIIIVVIKITEDEVTIGKETSTMMNASTEITDLTRIGEIIAKREITIKEIIVLNPSKLNNRYSRKNNEDSNYNKYRSYSRERKNNYDSSRESSRDRSYDRDFMTYKQRDDQDRETRRNYKQLSKKKTMKKKVTQKNWQYSTENSRERIPEKYKEDRYAKESERVT